MPTPRPSFACLGLAACLGVVAAASIAAAPPGNTPRSPTPTLDAWGFDPAVLVADGIELLGRAPDRAVDGLFQAVHSAASEPGEADALCALFESDGDRSLAGMNAAAEGLEPESRERFALAVAEVLVEATRNPPQAFDPDTARQALKSAGATAAILHADFLPGMQGTGEQRCRSFGMLLDALADRPLGERAAVTRLLLHEGLSRAAASLR